MSNRTDRNRKRNYCRSAIAWANNVEARLCAAFGVRACSPPRPEIKFPLSSWAHNLNAATHPGQDSLAAYLGHALGLVVDNFVNNQAQRVAKVLHDRITGGIFLRDGETDRLLCGGIKYKTSAAAQRAAVALGYTHVTGSAAREPNKVYRIRSEYRPFQLACF